MAGVSGNRDMVHIHVTDNLPIQARGLPFADRVEIRFGRAFPVTLVIDATALDRLSDALLTGRRELDAARKTKEA
jgi:hypothetical protein